MARQHGYSWDAKKSEELIQMMDVIANQLMNSVAPALDTVKLFTQTGVVFSAECNAMEQAQECYKIMEDFQETLKTKSQELQSFAAAFAEQYNIVLQQNFSSSADAMDKLRKTVASIKEA